VNDILINLLFSTGSVLLVLILHGYLVACEISLVKLRYSGVDTSEMEALKAHPGIGKIIENSDRVGRQVRFSKTLCTVAVGLFLIPIVHDIFKLADGSAELPGRWLVAALALLVAVSTHFFFGEMIPRGLAMRDPLTALKKSYRVLQLFQVITWPVMFLFRRIKRPVYRWIGADIDDELNPLDVDVQIRAMGEDSNALGPVVRKIVNRALTISDLVVQDILLPRSQVISCDLEEPLEHNLQRMRAAGHTRFPLCRGDLDHCIGIIHIKDIFRSRGPVEQIDPIKLRRNIVVFPTETKVEDALERMLVGKFHMGLVVDEFGGTVGLITLESILEELVGEIQDEFDFEEDQIKPLDAPRTFRISGLAALHDVEEMLDIEIDNDDVSTFGGLITGELGRIPEKGETLSVYGLDIAVEEVDERRVISAHVCVSNEADETSSPEAETKVADGKTTDASPPEEENPESEANEGKTSG